MSERGLRALPFVDGWSHHGGVGIAVGASQSTPLVFLALLWLGLLAAPGAILAGDTPVDTKTEEVEKIDSTACMTCHEPGTGQTPIDHDLSQSIHASLVCLDCHIDKDSVPHAKPKTPFFAGCEGCRTCHEEESRQYQKHGRAPIGTCADIPHCSSCHGAHDVLPSTSRDSKTYPANLPRTCGTCHENLKITRKYDILVDTPVQIYDSSVHGRATRAGISAAATCNDCHSTGGSAHLILGPGDKDSTINHFNIPNTCGKCHREIERDYMEGIHGRRVSQGETDVPVCTTCHGEHGITSPADPRSPVSPLHVAKETCSKCHESAVLNEKYGLPGGRLASFVDSYHGLKSMAGDTHVANCASCHGVHRILPSSDPTSTVNRANLQKTCGTCHPGISAKLAAAPIHAVTGQGLRTRAADIVERVYIVAIIVIVGLMSLHCLLDLFRQIRNRLRRGPQIIRMRAGEVWQHTLLTATFVVLVISGFSLRFGESWFARLFFGWEGGSGWRHSIHRAAAVLFALTILWHMAFLATTRPGRRFVSEMIPARRDFAFFWHRILYSVGRRDEAECVQRFNYVEKAEYWALVWGSVVMAATGILLWFDNWFIHYLPKGALDVSLVIHYWEAWLATLAILIWHLYAVVFDPRVYPMNPSWITGRMPESMYGLEHAGHLEQARKETAEFAREDTEGLSTGGGTEPPERM